MLPIRFTRTSRSEVPAELPDGFYERVFKGGPGSGFHGHAGRPGEVGGSSSAGGGGKEKSYKSHAEIEKDYPKANHGRSLVDLSEAEIEEARMADVHPKGLDTLDQYTTKVVTDEKGKVIARTLTPERQAMGDRLKREVVGEHGLPDTPVAYVLGGGTAVGKSTILKELGVPEDRVHVDVDSIRLKLPEWEAEMNQAKAEGRNPHGLIGFHTHEESSDIAKAALMEGVRKGNHVLLDGTGDSDFDKFKAKVQEMSENGKRPVIANYVTADFDEAYQRMRARGDKPGTKESGRYVPAKHMREIHSAVSRIFQEAAKQGLFTEFTLWDTTGPMGSKPVKVVSGKGKNMVIHNQEAWDKFLERGKGIAPRPGQI